ncbi:major facilitator superfamily domain-containing protein 6-like [Argonauta hians]
MLITNVSIWLVSSSIDSYLEENCLLKEIEQQTFVYNNVSKAITKFPTNATKNLLWITEFPSTFPKHNNTQQSIYNISEQLSTVSPNPVYSQTNGNVSETKNGTLSDIAKPKSFQYSEITTKNVKLTKFWNTYKQLPRKSNQSLHNNQNNYTLPWWNRPTPLKRVKRNIKPQIIVTTQETVNSTAESWNIQKIWQNIRKWINDIKTDEQMKVFLVLLAIILVGEIFGSAAEKISDDCWYDLLDSLDILEKYGSHRIWSSLAFLLVPTGVGILVDRTQCLLPEDINHILIHCFVFASFLLVSLFFAFVFPSPTFQKCISAVRHRKGIEVTCFGCNGFVYMMTVFVMGAVYSTISNFLFWYLEDIGSNETIMGLCILVNTLSEIPVLLYGDHLVRYLGSAGTTCFSMVFCSLRVFVYSFVYSPWYFLPLELLHALTHTTLWYAVFSNPIFNINPDVDRTIRNILSSVYFGIGFSAGSIASGYIVGAYGIAVLFRVVAVVCLTWSIVFYFISKYMPREKSIRYQRLLQMDEGNFSDDSSAVETDWLEQALKNN